MNLDLLYKDADVEVKGDREILASSERVLFSFTGGGLNEGKTRVQMPEFVGTSSRQGGLIVVTDVWRSWGNHIDWAKLNAAIAPYIEGKPLFSIGNSMGGFLSILATRFLPIKTAIAFVPQFTWHRDVIPDETRWTRYRRNVRFWNYVTLTDAILPDRNYYVFYGGDEAADLAHARCFPAAPNLHRYIIPGEGHGVANGLKAAGALDDVVGACVAGTFSLDVIRDKLTVEPYEMDQDAAPTPHHVPRPEDAPDPSSWPQPHPREMTPEAYQAWEARRTERHARLSPEERQARQERRAARRAELDDGTGTGARAAGRDRDRAGRPDRAAREAARAARGDAGEGAGGRGEGRRSGRASRGEGLDDAAREARRAAILAARAQRGGGASQSGRTRPDNGGGGPRSPEALETRRDRRAEQRGGGGDAEAQAARRAHRNDQGGGGGGSAPRRETVPGIDSAALEARRIARRQRNERFTFEVSAEDGRSHAGQDADAAGMQSKLPTSQ